MKRFIGIDIIKVSAALFVISVHFFLHTGYYWHDLTPGENLFAQTALRWFFLICVPLFMITTGYLQSKKQITWTYYKGIFPVLGVYLFYSLISIFVRIRFFDEQQSFATWFYEVISFKANGYAWYVNMFIGLFLLAPFLNLVFNNLKSKKEGLILIGILILLSGAPNFFNYMPIEINGSKIMFFPDWWMGLYYPLTYYFIGCYIKKYQPKVKKAWATALLILCLLISTSLTYYFSNGGPFANVIGEYSSITVTLTAVMFYLLVYNINIGENFIAKGISYVSGLTLDIYLASYFVDRFVYQYVMSNIFESNYQIIYYFIPIVGSIIVLCILLSIIRKLITESVSYIIRKLTGGGKAARVELSTSKRENYSS